MSEDTDDLVVTNLLADYTNTMLEYGVNSAQYLDFLIKHDDNHRFVKLANVATSLRLALANDDPYKPRGTK